MTDTFLPAHSGCSRRSAWRTGPAVVALALMTAGAAPAVSAAPSNPSTRTVTAPPSAYPAAEVCNRTKAENSPVACQCRRSLTQRLLGKVARKASQLLPAPRIAF